MKTFLLQIFTWWNGQTIGTRFFTWRKGEKVGTDLFGNVYYRSRGGAIDPALGHERRWVIYKGEADASMIPPDGMAGCITASMFRPLRKITAPASGKSRIRATRPAQPVPIARRVPPCAPASASRRRAITNPGIRDAEVSAAPPFFRRDSHDMAARIPRMRGKD